MIVWQSNVNAQASGHSYLIRRQQLLNNYVSITTAIVVPPVVSPSPGGGRLGRAFTFEPIRKKKKRKTLTKKGLKWKHKCLQLTMKQLPLKENQKKKEN